MGTFAVSLRGSQKLQCECAFPGRNVYWVTARMGSHLARKKWLLAAAIFVAPALAFGYYAGDPTNLGIPVNSTVSGVGSVHTRHVPVSADATKHKEVAHEAAHLFALQRKGPRADRYVEFTHSRKGTQPETKIAKAPVRADMIVTGSIPPGNAQRVALHNAEGSGFGNVGRDGYISAGLGGGPTIPSADPSSASMFLSSLLKPNSAQIPEVAGGNGKVRRGLKFKGESESEYQARQRRCLATAIYFEARGESKKGQIAVAQVVMNRVRSSLYPDTICGVVFQGQMRSTGCQFSFTCDGRSDFPKDKAKWRQANEIAKQMTQGKSFLGDIGYSTHYHANYVAPPWRRELNKVKKVGTHIFYRVKGEQIEDVLSPQSPRRGLALAGNG